MEADSDGAPNAYAPAGSGITTLDYLGNAGHPDRWLDENSDVVTDAELLVRLEGGEKIDGYHFQKADWYGLVCDAAGEPVIQTASDPCPGCYVSPTALQSVLYPVNDPRRYVNADEIPYISVPPEILALGVRKGDLAIARLGTKRAGAVVGDVGPRGKIGEGSLALHRALGFDPQRAMPKHKLVGINSGVWFEIHLGTASSPAWPRPTLAADLAALLGS
jgi:hypothetical protein